MTQIGTYSVRASWGALSDYRNVMYGIAITCIILFHLYESTAKGSVLHASLWMFTRMGSGVDAFLFLSSMSLYFAYSPSRSLSRFYRRRAMRILPAFLVVAIPYYLWRNAVVTPNSTFFFDLTNVSFLVEGYRTYWYVYAILLLYALYPALHRFICCAMHPFRRMVAALIVSFALTAAVGLWNPELLQNTEILLTRFPAFAAGVYAGMLVKERADMRGRQLLALVAVALALWALSCTKLLRFGSTDVAARYFYTCAAVLSCMIAPQLLAAFRCACDQQPLKFLGRISLEAYIANQAVRNIVEWYWGGFLLDTGSTSRQLMYCAIVVVATVVGAWALHRLTAPLTKKLMGK